MRFQHGAVFVFDVKAVVIKKDAAFGQRAGRIFARIARKTSFAAVSAACDRIAIDSGCFYSFAVF